MKFLSVLLFIFTAPIFAETILECQGEKCSEIIRLTTDQDYRIFDSANHLQVNACYKRKSSGYTYFYKVESINEHFVNVIYERHSSKKSFEYMLYREKISFQDSELNGAIQKFPCQFTPKLWDKKYLTECLKRKSKRKNFCRQPLRAPKDFRKGARP